MACTRKEGSLGHDLVRGYDFEEWVDAGEVIRKATDIYMAEDDIDLNCDLMLFTWNPDPKQLPDVDFSLQHRYNIEFLQSFLKYVRCGIMCVESTKKGNPHYHGWYQSFGDNRDLALIAVIKAMQQTGQYEVMKNPKHVVINSYSDYCNALHYYKKDLFGSMIGIKENPITLSTVCGLVKNDMDQYKVFLGMMKCYDKKIAEKQSERSKIQSFYKDSLNWLREDTFDPDDVSIPIQDDNPVRYYK